MEVDQRDLSRTDRAEALQGFIGPSPNSVVGSGSVRDVGSRKTRHVTLNAVVVWVGFAALHGRRRASLFLMTLKTTPAVIADLFFLGRQSMRVMAGDASQLAIAGPEAAAGVHLLDLADCLRIARRPAGRHENCPVLMKR